MNSQLLKKLLDVGDAFEQVHPNPADHTLPTFLAWATARQPSQPEPVPDAHYTVEVPVLQTFMAEHLTKAYRYFRVYVKKALDEAPLLTFDDFISLAYLADRGSMTKTELIETTVNEKTSGMLVIKRLLDKGFVVQSDDKQDKRSQQLTITAAGLATMHTIQPRINQATAMLKGDFSVSEQRYLGVLLARLDKFHRPIFRSGKDTPLDELVRALPAQ